MRDSSRLNAYVGETMLPGACEIGAALNGCCARGALILTPPTGLHQVRVAATRAGTIDRLIPGDKVAGGVPLAAKKGATLLRAALDNLPFAAGWTAHADPLQERAGVATLGEPAARLELPEFP